VPAICCRRALLLVSVDLCFALFGWKARGRPAATATTATTTATATTAATTPKSSVEDWDLSDFPLAVHSAGSLSLARFKN